MSRPDMRFVPIKSADQQAVLMLHKTRELLVKQRTMTVNALRGHLSEFGLIAPKGIHRVKELLALALADETLPEEAKQASAMLASHSGGLDEKIDDLEKTIARASGKNQTSQLLDEIPAFGPLIASAIAALTPDPRVFRSGSDFSASLGLTPSQHRAAVRTSSAPSPKRATDICARCWSWDARRCCGWPTNTKGPWPNGSSP